MICPNCQKEIPADVKACGYCGYWLDTEAVPPVGAGQGQIPWLWVGVGGTVLVVIVLVAIIAFLAGRGGEGGDTEATVAAALTAARQTDVAMAAPEETEPTEANPVAATAPLLTATPPPAGIGDDSELQETTPTETGTLPAETSLPTPTTAVPTNVPTDTPLPTPTNPPPSPSPTPAAAPATNLTEAQARQAWSASGHAAADDEAFVHWNGDSPPQVPESCAKCHSLYGFLDFLGADGSAPGQVDQAAPIGSVLECEVCHHEMAEALTSVVMPSGIEITDLGPEARCMQCHQGRQSTISVNEMVGDTGEDVVNLDIGFVNVHYYPAAATKYGATAMGGYQYPGKPYATDFTHVEDFNSCVECHDSHTLQVRGEACLECHPEISERLFYINIRNQDSPLDYDGDGKPAEGIFLEIRDLQHILYQNIQTYADEVAGVPVVYEVNNYPYFFIDTNGNGKPDDKEADFGNRYNAWTPRLLKAAYNYQVSVKDPGAYIHNARYVIQLLYDSIEDLNAALAEPVDLSIIKRGN